MYEGGDTGSPESPTICSDTAQGQCWSVPTCATLSSLLIWDTEAQTGLLRAVRRPENLGGSLLPHQKGLCHHQEVE